MTIPMDPDPNAVEVAPGVWRHWGLYLRGAAKIVPRTELKCLCWKPTQPQKDCPRHRELTDGRY